MPTNDDTLKKFLDYFNAHDYNNLMDQFCDDVPLGHKPYFLFPIVGITDHGPAFYGRDDVGTLFDQLFKTFLDMTWTQYTPPKAAAPAPRLYTKDGVLPGEIGIQMDINGTFTKHWFAPTDTTHGSLPLSQLSDSDQAQPLGKNKNHHTGLPAFAVFTFNDKYLIQQLQLYLDRYAMMQSIGLAWNPDGVAPRVGLGVARDDRVISEAHGRRITITIED